MGNRWKLLFRVSGLGKTRTRLSISSAQIPIIQLLGTCTLTSTLIPYLMVTPIRVWVRCKLRLSYTPVFGAHAAYRSAGPLAVDTQKPLEELGTEAPYSEHFRDKTIAWDGAERSCLTRLEKIREQKAKMAPRGASPKSGTRPTTTRTEATSSEAPGGLGGDDAGHGSGRRPHYYASAPETKDAQSRGDPRA